MKNDYLTYFPCIRHKAKIDLPAAFLKTTENNIGKQRASTKEEKMGPSVLQVVSQQNIHHYYERTFKVFFRVFSTLVVMMVAKFKPAVHHAA